MTPQTILDYAVKNSFTDICLTDHFWDENVPGATPYIADNMTYSCLAKALPLPTSDVVRFMFGCETELDMRGTLAISRETFDKFDFVVIPINHFHMNGFTVSEEDFCHPHRIASLWVERFLHVLGKDLPFSKIGFAHLSCELMDVSSRTAHLDVCDLISEDDLKRCFSRAAERGAGIELNFETFFDYSESELERLLRMYRVAKDEGCKFYFGSDAHHPEELSRSKDKFNIVVDLLGLTEDDKYRVPK